MGIGIGGITAMNLYSLVFHLYIPEQLIEIMTERTVRPRIRERLREPRKRITKSFRPPFHKHKKIKNHLN